jgi:uncharacterized protein YwqG
MDHFIPYHWIICTEPMALFFRNIHENAFYQSGLTSIIIPNSVKTIEAWAFYACGNLESIVIPEGVETIEEGTFYECKKLTKLILPGSIKTINKSAFAGCGGLESVIIPEGVETIEAWAFAACRRLKKLTIPESINTIGENAFRGVKVVEYTIPDKVFKIKNTGLKIKKTLPDIKELTICFTGTLGKMKRAEAQKAVVALGGQTAASINKKVNLVVAGAGAGSKLDKADDLGIDIISEDEFLVFIGKGDEIDTNEFKFTNEQLEILKQVSSKEQRKLIEKFVKLNAVPCYYLEIDEYEEPTALDSSFGGIPYCPVGEELPKDEDGNGIPLLLQINFEGVNLPGYPNKGIFQMFAGDEDYCPYLDEEGAIVRYYEKIDDNYRKDLEPSVNDATNGNHKLKLVRGWSVYDFYARSTEDFDESKPKEAKILEKLRELEDDEYLHEAGGILQELFPKRSNFGGYAGPTPQHGSWMFPEDALLFLASDMLYWGDSGEICYFYKDITKLEKDSKIAGVGDMC